MLPSPPNCSNQLPLRLKGIWVRTMMYKITKGNAHDRYQRLSRSQLRKEAAITKTDRLPQPRRRTRAWGSEAARDLDSVGSRGANPTRTCTANICSYRAQVRDSPMGFQTVKKPVALSLPPPTPHPTDPTPPPPRDLSGPTPTVLGADPPLASQTSEAAD